MQLVELQRTVQEEKRDDVAVFAISYDPVSVLAGFSAKHDITYTLMSDEGSIVITSLGLLNERIPEERAHYGKPMDDLHRGLPWPGTFLLDEDGLIVERFFERSHRVRPSGAVLLDVLVGSRGAIPERAVTSSVEGIAAAVWTDEPTYFPSQWQRLRVRLVIDAGLHIYLPPVPKGYHALQIEVEGPEGLLTSPADLPEGSPLTFDVLNETFSVAEGIVDLAVPFYVLEGTGDLDVSVKIHVQACTDEACFMPQTMAVAVPILADRMEP